MKWHDANHLSADPQSRPPSLTRARRAFRFPDTAVSWWDKRTTGALCAEATCRWES